MDQEQAALMGSINERLADIGSALRAIGDQQTHIVRMIEKLYAGAEASEPLRIISSPQ